MNKSFKNEHTFFPRILRTLVSPPPRHYHFHIFADAQGCLGQGQFVARPRLRVPSEAATVPAPVPELQAAHALLPTVPPPDHQDEPVPRQAEPPREILGPQSSVETLRARLKELRKLGVVDAAIYGTKKQLWERLVSVPCYLT